MSVSASHLIEVFGVGVSKTMKNSRLMLLGLDAISLPFVWEHLDTLPNFADMLNSGHVQNIGSTAKLLSASVWPTFISGKMPGEHGQYFPMQWDPSAQRFHRIYHQNLRSRVITRPFWHDLAQDGADVIAFDIAHVMDDETAPCLQITNWSYQSSGDVGTSDPEVLKEIQNRFGKRPIGPEVPVSKSRKECIALRNNLIEATKRKGEAIRYLMDRPWDLFVTAMYEVHRAGHNLWPIEAEFASDAEPDAMLAVYQETDRQIGLIRQKLHELCGDDSALVLYSLHGVEENWAQDHFLPEILRRLNSVYFNDPVPEDDGTRSLNVMAYLRKALPAPVQYRLAAILGERIQDAVVNRSTCGGLNWSKTPAFAMVTAGEGLIRLNVRGREQIGLLSPEGAEVDEFISWLTRQLMSIKVTETGEPLVQEVIRTKDIFPGPKADLLPDLILSWAPDVPVKSVTSATIGNISSHLATGRGGNHNDDAFVLAVGSKHIMRQAAKVQHISDIAELARKALQPTRDQIQSAAY